MGECEACRGLQDRILQLEEGQRELRVLLCGKADAEVVVSHADTQYVDSTAERLRGDLLQTVETAHRTLVMTVDRSLAVLRRLIDQKAPLSAPRPYSTPTEAPQNNPEPRLLLRNTHPCSQPTRDGSAMLGKVRIKSAPSPVPTLQRQRNHSNREANLIGTKTLRAAIR